MSSDTSKKVLSEADSDVMKKRKSYLTALGSVAGEIISWTSELQRLRVGTNRCMKKALRLIESLSKVRGANPLLPRESDPNFEAKAPADEDTCFQRLRTSHENGDLEKLKEILDECFKEMGGDYFRYLFRCFNVLRFTRLHCHSFPAHSEVLVRKYIIKIIQWWETWLPPAKLKYTEEPFDDICDRNTYELRAVLVSLLYHQEMNTKPTSVRLYVATTRSSVYRIKKYRIEKRNIHSIASWLKVARLTAQCIKAIQLRSLRIEGVLATVDCYVSQERTKRLKDTLCSSMELALHSHRLTDEGKNHTFVVEQYFAHCHDIRNRHLPRMVFKGFRFGTPKKTPIPPTVPFVSIARFCDGDSSVILACHTSKLCIFEVAPSATEHLMPYLHSLSSMLDSNHPAEVVYIAFHGSDYTLQRFLELLYCCLPVVVPSMEFLRFAREARSHREIFPSKVLDSSSDSSSGSKCALFVYQGTNYTVNTGVTKFKENFPDYEIVQVTKGPVTFKRTYDVVYILCHGTPTDPGEVAKQVVETANSYGSLIVLCYCGSGVNTNADHVDPARDAVDRPSFVYKALRKFHTCVAVTLPTVDEGIATVFEDVFFATLAPNVSIACAAACATHLSTGDFAVFGHGGTLHASDSPTADKRPRVSCKCPSLSGTDLLPFHFSFPEMFHTGFFAACRRLNEQESLTIPPDVPALQQAEVRWNACGFSYSVEYEKKAHSVVKDKIIELTRLKWHGNARGKIHDLNLWFTKMLVVESDQPYQDCKPPEAATIAMTFAWVLPSIHDYFPSPAQMPSHQTILRRMLLSETVDPTLKGEDGSVVKNGSIAIVLRKKRDDEDSRPCWTSPEFVRLIYQIFSLRDKSDNTKSKRDIVFFDSEINKEYSLAFAGKTTNKFFDVTCHHDPLVRAGTSRFKETFPESSGIDAVEQLQYVYHMVKTYKVTHAIGIHGGFTDILALCGVNPCNTVRLFGARWRVRTENYTQRLYGPKPPDSQEAWFNRFPTYNELKRFLSL